MFVAASEKNISSHRDRDAHQVLFHQFMRAVCTEIIPPLPTRTVLHAASSWNPQINNRTCASSIL